MDFASLPPEINSGRMYFGAGAAPMLGAAAAWNTLAGELRSASAAYSSVIADVTAVWQGPSSEEMARAAASYSAWIDLTAANAERTAEQAKAAANAFDTAFAATVPPPIVAANRAQLAFLVATNVLGQNTPAIAATEIQYAAMWAQDAAAMDNYAVSSATAAQMTAFAPPAQATNSVDGRKQDAPPVPAASTLPSTMLSSLGDMSAPAATAADQAADPLAIIGALFGPTSPASVLTPAIGGYLVGTEPYGLASVGSSVAGLYQKLQALPSAGGLEVPQSAAVSGVSTVGSSASVSSGVGRAGLVGRLSVPPGWAAAAPEMKLAASVGPQVGLASAPNAIAADLPGNAYGSVALQGAASRAAAGADGFGRTARGGVQPWQSTTTIIVIPDDDDHAPQTYRRQKKD